MSYIVQIIKNPCVTMLYSVCAWVRRCLGVCDGVGGGCCWGEGWCGMSKQAIEREK